VQKQAVRQKVTTNASLLIEVLPMTMTMTMTMTMLMLAMMLIVIVMMLMLIVMIEVLPMIVIERMTMIVEALEDPYENFSHFSLYSKHLIGLWLSFRVRVLALALALVLVAVTQSQKLVVAKSRKLRRTRTRTHNNSWTKRNTRKEPSVGFEDSTKQTATASFLVCVCDELLSFSKPRSQAPGDIHIHIHIDIDI